MAFLLRFVQVSRVGTYANCAGWQCLVQASEPQRQPCKGSACLSLQLQRDL